MGHFANYGIDQNFIDQVRAKVTPGTSALFLLSSGAVADKVADAVKGQQFEIIQTNLSKEQEDKLRADFGESEKRITCFHTTTETSTVLHGCKSMRMR